jgi:hypothetical protein
MAASANVKFVYRHLPGGAVEAICLKCYRTIAATMNNEELESKERAHQCDGMDLAELLTPRTPKPTVSLRTKAPHS